MTWLALLLVLVLTWALGPLVPVIAVALLLVPRVRRAVWPRHPWWWVAGWVAAAAALVAAVVLLPEGTLRLPPGAGALVTPGYVGHPSRLAPLPAPPVPQNPHLAANGRSSMHDDAYATDAYSGPGPRGRDPQVRTAWYGVKECATLAFDQQDRLLGLCGGPRGPVFHVIDPDTLRPVATYPLPPRVDRGGGSPLSNLCGGAYFYLSDRDDAVVATTDRRLFVLRASEGAHPTLRRVHQYDLTREVPAADCVIAVLPDWSGRIWFESKHGLVGTIDPATGTVRTHRLPGEEIVNSFATDEDGGVYIVSTHALYRFRAAGDGAPVVAWRTAYDRGPEQKPGQLSRGSGTTPTLLGRDRVAITDNAAPRMHVLVLDRATGRRTCSVAVLTAGASDTENSLVAAGDSVLVENNYGYTGPWSTMLGRTTTPGIASVDTRSCRVTWTSDVVAPTSVPKASLATGLLYAYTKRPSALGVNAWYLTALDLRTGRTAFSVRTAIGTLANNHYSAVTLGPDGAAYIATLGGMVRVSDG